MFFPYSTDAPIYHWPVTTVAMIAVNVLAFFGEIAAINNGHEELIYGLCLQLGQGLHPIQWVTANFLHVGVLHLVGNMFGLWSFGLIVEGKIGWWRYLIVYFGVGIVVMAITQVVSLGMDPNIGLGASGVVYGLIGVALIWAPENDMQCFVFLGFRMIFFEMTVWALAMLFMGMQILFISFSKLTFSSEAVHLLGAFIGMGVGVAMLRREWVDCENWDLFSVWTGRNRLSRDELAELEAREKAKREPVDVAAQRAAALEQVRRVLAEGKIDLALAAHRKMSQRFEGWALPEGDLCKLIVGASKQCRHADVVTLSREYLRQYTERAAAVRLKLAETLIRHEDRPAQARRVMAKVPDATLGKNELALRRQLEKEAAAKIDSGAIEPATEEW